MKKFKNKKQLVVLICMLVALPAMAQNAYYRSSWQKQPEQVKLSDSLLRYSAVFLLDETIVEYVSDRNEVFINRTIHNTVKVNDEKGVAGFNTISIPASPRISVASIKARTITASGKVIDLPASSIKSVKNDEGAPLYLFAMEGVDQGSIIEWQYREKRPLAYFGFDYRQYSIPVVNSIFTIVSPKDLIFEVKSYNGLANSKDSAINELNYYSVRQENIPAVQEEEYSYRGANLMHVDYKISYLKKNPDSRLFTWNDMAKNVYNNLCDFSKKDLKTAGKYLESIGVNVKDDNREKISKIEEALKTNIVVNDEIESTKESIDFSNIIYKKLTTEIGFTNFMSACFTAAEVPFELGLAADKKNHPLDEKLENWNTLNHYLFYFPEEKMWLDPTAVALRAPFIPTDYAGSKGVFSKVTTMGSMTTALAAIRNIDMMPPDASQGNLDATINFSSDMTPLIDITHSMTGYSAYTVRTLFYTVSKDKEKELLTAILGLTEKENEVKKYEIKNAAFSNYSTNTPLIYSATVDAPALMEKAGTKYLFKVGDVIGRQSELYSTEARRLSVDMDNTHILDRTITINIPEGYKIINPEQAVIKVKEENDKMGFISNYTINDKQMVLKLHEYYLQTHFPLAKYGIFRDVINAAADFNKVVLVLEKK